ncbi:hypothetical protein L9F63_003429, partial [Diploptera punctata]
LTYQHQKDQLKEKYTMAVDRMKVIFQHLHGRELNPSLSETSAVAEHLSTDNFRYTVNDCILSYNQRKFYEENGYIVIPKLIEDNQIEKYRQRFLDVCNGKIPKGHMTLMKESSLRKTDAKGERLYYKLQDFVWDDVLSDYIHDPKVLDYVECFTGPNIKAMHTMLINKPPDSGKMTSIHPLHQDLHYFPFRPADRIVAAWTAMERVDEDNGCLVVIPGSHKGDLLPHDYPKWDQGVNKAFHSVEGFEDHPLISLKMEKGDTVFFHPILIHGSGVNITKQMEEAISCHYAASECEYIDVQGTTQENIAKEIEEMARHKGLVLDFQSVWKYRCRLNR